MTKQHFHYLFYLIFVRFVTEQSVAKHLSIQKVLGKDSTGTKKRRHNREKNAVIP